MIKQMLATSVALGLAAFPAAAVVQTYNGTGGALADATVNNTTPGNTNFVINVGNLGTINSVVSVNLVFGAPAHTWVGDMEVTLIAPNLDDVHIFSRVGNTTSTGFGDSSDVTAGGAGYTFVNSGGASFLTAATSTTGAVALGTYNRSTSANTSVAGGVDSDDYTVFNGDGLNGNWTLNIKDWGVGDIGPLTSWSITIDYTDVPAPGALALLGLAGVVGRRRRNA